MKRKALSLLLALVLCLGLAIPAAAYELTSSGYAFEASNDPVAILDVEASGNTEKVYVFPDNTTISAKNASDELYWDVHNYYNGIFYWETSNSGDVLELNPFINGNSYDYFYQVWYMEGYLAGQGHIYVVPQTVAVNKGMIDGSASTPSTPAETTPSTPDTSTTPATGMAFTDVAANSAFAPAISWAVENGITTGKTSTTFAPNENCSNGQIITFLWRANGSPEPTIANPYQDAIPDSFQKAAIWASEKGLVTGSIFGSDTPCTRSMVVTYLWQLAGKPTESGPSNFPDVASNAEYAQAVAWAVQIGITTGKTDGTFAPNEVCTRGQIVTFIYRDIAP